MGDKGLNFDREDNRPNYYNFHNGGNGLEMSTNQINGNKLESQIQKDSLPALKDLCRLLLSSFCGILDDFGLETQADEEMLLLAIESGDFDTVVEYVKLFKNKMSSILLLNNIGRDSRAEMDIGLSVVPDPIQVVGSCEDGDNMNLGRIHKSSDDKLINHSEQDRIDNDFVNMDSNEFNNNRADLNSSELRNMRFLSPNTSNTSNQIKKSPVPPLNIEKAGPGSWNRGQLPNEYPTE
ncbi:hypothetical protein OIY81_834 [Cryptosporidium canis]|uniref:Uncharacterized protein n=1 Tax=Cryptosporidium canis TaxID=195482 RepID=A0ABQ8P4I0_9CRYT|nr:hypothetical protein OJ252_2684 [Cryptosporidium canis]KAJ1613853.1 hypothetical protein OIY81_834 [Cryptosporidium canis]